MAPPWGTGAGFYWFDTSFLRGNDAGFRVSGEFERCCRYQFSDEHTSMFRLGAVATVE
jgi:hypothetical protein